jgi:DNA-binding CsgD family transcriptional regulator
MRAGLERAFRGHGGVILAEGSAGIGKTALLASAVQAAEATGFEVLAAQGRELEREFGFGVARQLFQGPLAEPGVETAPFAGAAGLVAPLVSPDAPPPSATEAMDSFQVMHGLYWLLANLSDRQPLLVAVDDAHWSDSASLRFLAFAAPRLADLPILLIAMARPTIANQPEPLAAIRAASTVTRIDLEPLSRDAVTGLASDWFGVDVDAGFAAACHRATGGNPFLLLELLAELRRDQIEPNPQSAERVDALGPHAVSTAVLADLAMLSPAASPLARAAAVLETCNVDQAAALAELDTEVARRSADELVGANVLTPAAMLEFRHAIVRNAVYEDIGPNSRAALHARAAKIIAQDERALERAASHLLRSTPGADPETVELLLRAGHSAISRGSPETACSYLIRALAEAADSSMRGEVLWTLGRAEMLAGSPDSRAHLGEALPLLREPSDRIEATRDLATAFVLQLVDEPVRAVDVLECAIEQMDENDVAGRATLGCDLVCFASIGGDRRPRVELEARRIRRLADGGWGEGTTIGRRVLIRAGLDAVMAGEPAGNALDLTETALADGRFLAEERVESAHFPAAVFTFLFSDRIDRAESILNFAIADAQERSSLVGFALASGYRSMTLLRRGALSEAEADARTGLEAAPTPVTIPFLVACLLNVMIEQGSWADADQVLDEHGMSGSPGTSWGSLHLREARGRLRTGQGRAAEGLQDLLEAGELTRGSGTINPAIIPWRSSAALAQHALGTDREAIRLAGEELSLARRFGAPRPVGVALRALGLVESGKQGLDHLHESVEVLAQSPSSLELAHSQIELGAALRRANRRVDARKLLEPALERVQGWGAGALAERALEELRATGARPRRAVLSGVDSLTASERRVAQMAAEGLSNPEIAQRLFVTRKTIEFHLGQCYRKLDISSRGELPGALAPQPGNLHPTPA